MDFPPAALRARRLGFYGGTFDPPHRGHLFVAQEALRSAGLDALLWVPARQSPHKQAGAVDGAVRAELVELCLADARAQGDPAALVAHVWRGELERPEPSYTIDSIEQLLAARRPFWSAPAPEVYLVMGADQLDAIERWARVNELLRLVRPIVVDRAVERAMERDAAAIRAARRAHLDACEAAGSLAPDVAARLREGLLDTGRLPISSTALRAGRAAQATELTPSVRARIERDHLYG